MRVGPDDRRGPAFARPEFDDSPVSDVVHEAVGLADNWIFRATRHETLRCHRKASTCFEMWSQPRLDLTDYVRLGSLLLSKL